MLYSRLFARKEKGIVLHSRQLEDTKKKKADSRPHTHHGDIKKEYIVSFGGLTSILEEPDLVSKNRTPKDAVLFSYNKVSASSSTIPSPFTLPSSQGLGIGPSVVPMRLDHAVLESPPIVVGHRKQGLKAVRLATKVTTKSHGEHQRTSNPHTPGSWMYMTLEPPTTLNEQLQFKAETKADGPFQPSMRQKEEPKQMSTSDSKELLNSLRNLVESKDES